MNLNQFFDTDKDASVQNAIGLGMYRLLGVFFKFRVFDGWVQYFSFIPFEKTHTLTKEKQKKQ